MITIIPTAHISQESVEEVRNKILELKPDIIAVELCETRYNGLREERDIPVIDLIKGKNSAIVITNILLSLLQRKLGDEVGVKPGKEMLTAIDTAQELGVNFTLIDRDIKITLNRAFSRMSLLEKLRTAKEMISAFSLSKDEVEKEIEDAKNDDNVAKLLEKFQDISPRMFETLVYERDAFMASKLLKLKEKFNNIVAVVGAGHKKGIEKYLAEPEKLPPMSELLETPRKKITIGKVLKFGIPALIIGTFILSLYKGIALDRPAQQWILYHSLPTFVLVLIVGGSIASAVVGMFAAPITALHPLLAAGWFVGLAEIKVRRVTVGDVSDIFKTSNFGELYKNKAFKVLLVTAVANIGSSLGTFVSFPTILLPLLKNVFG